MRVCNNNNTQSQSTFYLAVQLLDTYLAANKGSTPDLNFLATAALYTAAKSGEIDSTLCLYECVERIGNQEYTYDQFTEFELNILKLADYNTCQST